MARQRLQFDLLDGPFIMGVGGGGENAVHETPDAKLLNLGTTASPVKFSTSGNVVNCRGYSTHASGDVRNIYNRLYLYGAGGGESLRTFTSVMTNLGTAHGSHTSLNFAATAGGSECSGLGVVSRNTLHIPNVASWAPTGTYAALQAEIYSDGTASDPAGMTELSFLRFINAGNATGKADVDTDAFLFSIQGMTAAANKTKLLSSVSLNELPANSVALKIKIGSGTYWLLAVADAELN